MVTDPVNHACSALLGSSDRRLHMLYVHFCLVLSSLFDYEID